MPKSQEEARLSHRCGWTQGIRQKAGLPRTPSQTLGSVGFQGRLCRRAYPLNPLGATNPTLAYHLSPKVMEDAVPGRTNTSFNVPISVSAGKWGPGSASLGTRHGRLGGGSQAEGGVRAAGRQGCTPEPPHGVDRLSAMEHVG